MVPDKETYHLETIYKLNDGLNNFVYQYLCSMSYESIHNVAFS